MSNHNSKGADRAVLAIDIGGSHVKIRSSAGGEERKAVSCNTMSGADMVAVAREAMLAIGCIQAQRCHTGGCPTGVATQNRWLVRGLDPTDKAARLANYVITLRKELTRLSHACEVEHPALLTANHMEILDGNFGSRPLSEVFGYEPGWELPAEADRREVLRMMGEGA